MVDTLGLHFGDVGSDLWVRMKQLPAQPWSCTEMRKTQKQSKYVNCTLTLKSLVLPLVEVVGGGCGIKALPTRRKKRPIFL